MSVFVFDRLLVLQNSSATRVAHADLITGDYCGCKYLNIRISFGLVHDISRILLLLYYGTTVDTTSTWWYFSTCFFLLTIHFCCVSYDGTTYL